jgi:GTP-binding protein
LTKADALTPEAIKAQSAALKKAAGRVPLVLSSQSGTGVSETLRALIAVIEKARTMPDAASQEATSQETTWQP